MTVTAHPAFIFDMDGTLVDNMPYHNRAWLAYLNEIGARPDPSTFHDLTAGKTNPEILRSFLGQNLSDADVKLHALAKEQRYRAAYRNEIQPIPGLLGFLERARQAGIHLGLATSAGPENIELVLAGLGLRDCFQAIVNGDEVRKGKPDPEIFLTTLARLGADPRHSLVFEDSRGGIEAARRAGLPVVAILTGLTASQALEYSNVRFTAADYLGLDPAALLGQEKPIQ